MREVQKSAPPVNPGHPGNRWRGGRPRDGERDWTLLSPAAGAILDPMNSLVVWLLAMAGSIVDPEALVVSLGAAKYEDREAASRA